MAFAEIPDVVGEAPLHTVDLLLHLADLLESRERVLDLPEDVDVAFHHLSADTALRVALDNNGASFAVGGDVDIRVAADDDRPAVDERGGVVADVPGHADHSALHAAPLAPGG